MGEEKKKKGFFRRAADAFSSKDEKEALEKTRKELDEAKKTAVQAQSREKLATAQAKMTAQNELQEIEKRGKDAESHIKQMEQEENIKKMQDRIRDRATEEKTRHPAQYPATSVAVPTPAAAHVPVPQALVKHTIAEGETLSHIAMKHYGHSTRDYWMLIYEANKAAIGDNPGLVKPGTELTIPVLPDTLKGN